MSKLAQHSDALRAPSIRASRDGEDLADRLIDVFLLEGFANLSIDDFARHLRCSKSTVYSIAGSKERIISAVVKAYFRRATARVAARIADVEPASIERVRAYLLAISQELAASPAFLADIDAFAPTRELYRENTRLAASRLQALILEAVPAASQAEALFIGGVAAAVMSAIHRGEIEAAAGLDDSAAYRALARLIVAGVEASAHTTPEPRLAAVTEIHGSST